MDNDWTKEKVLNHIKQFVDEEVELSKYICKSGEKNNTEYYEGRKDAFVFVQSFIDAMTQFYI